MTNDIHSLTASIIARFDAFAFDFFVAHDAPTLREMIDAEMNANAYPAANRDAAILAIIDAQFDDSFAIITDDDANANSLYLEFIACDRFAFTVFLTAMIINKIA